MEQDREDYETNTYQDDINEDPDATDPFADAAGYDPAAEPPLIEYENWDFDDPTMDEELVREIKEQEARDYIDFLAEDDAA